jgi:hypothetical protein
MPDITTATGLLNDPASRPRICDRCSYEWTDDLPCGCARPDRPPLARRSDRLPFADADVQRVAHLIGHARDRDETDVARDVLEALAETMSVEYAKSSMLPDAPWERLRYVTGWQPIVPSAEIDDV